MDVETGKTYPSKDAAAAAGVPPERLVEVEGDPAALGRLREQVQKGAGMTGEDIDRAFTFHPPTNHQRVRYERLRSTARELALGVEKMCPPSRERSLALTKLREAVMWANASIACNEPAVPAAEYAEVGPEKGL